MEFTLQTKISQIVSDSRFSSFSDKLEFMQNILGFLGKRLTVERFCKLLPSWIHSDIPFGLNVLAQHIDNGIQVYHTFYSKNDIATDGTKSKSGLFYFPTNTKHASFALVLPGGAYANVATTVEGFPIAAKLNEMGINAFVLYYRYGRKNRVPAPICDLHSVLRYILSNEKNFHLNPTNYAVFGFSAGGHLASMIGTDNFGYKIAGLPRPGAIILSYPLVNFKTKGMIVKICKIMHYGFRPSLDRMNTSDVLLHLDKTCPPLFIWQGKHDTILPYDENALALANKALGLNIIHELKAFENVGHGSGLANNTEAQDWMKEAVEFWKRNTLYP